MSRSWEDASELPAAQDDERGAGGMEGYAALGVATTGVSAAVTATLASACCIGPTIAPLVVSVLGVGGAAWAAGLKPYSPYLLVGALLLLGYGFWTVYRPRITSSGDRCAPAVPWPIRTVLWAALALWMVALLLNIFLRS